MSLLAWRRMVRLPRISLLQVFIAVAITALDFAWLRCIVLQGRSFVGSYLGFHNMFGNVNSFSLELGVLGMVTILGFGFCGFAGRRVRLRPFLMGFEIFGLAAVFAYVGFCGRYHEVITPRHG